MPLTAQQFIILNNFKGYSFILMDNLQNLVKNVKISIIIMC